MANTQDIPLLAAQRLWTSAKTLRGREFCSIVNGALRDDDDVSEMDPTAALTYAINQMLCVGGPVRLTTFASEGVGSITATAASSSLSAKVSSANVPRDVVL